MASGPQKVGSGTLDKQGPVGQGNYEVQPGECMESIACEHGFLWQTLWNLPANAELRDHRSPSILLPGDQLTIPAIRLQQASCQTDQSNKFKLLGTHTRFRLRFLDDQQQPRSGVPYLLTIEGKTTSGTLDSQGSLNVPIPCDASKGSVRLQTKPHPETYPLDFGHLDPDSSPTGIRGRLNNLGFSCASDGDWDDELRAAIQRFQLACNILATGKLDDQTHQALTQSHQS
ncbi:MAG: peptidoglycan-binding protein [Candidatus Acidiferrum sp.]